MRRIRVLKRKNGQSLVETALIMPLIILILMGIIDFGMIFNSYLVVSNASREGARNAAVGKSDNNIVSIVNMASSTLDAAKITTTIYPQQAYRKTGDEVKITVEYQYTFLTPVVSSLMNKPFKLKSVSVMRVE